MGKTVLFNELMKTIFKKRFPLVMG